MCLRIPFSLLDSTFRGGGITYGSELTHPSDHGTFLIHCIRKRIF